MERLLNKNDPTLVELYEYLDSCSGWLGGDPNNPIWFCAMEPADGLTCTFSPLNYYPEQYPKGDPQPMSDELADVHFFAKYGGKSRPGGSAFFRSQVGILGYLVTGNKKTRAKEFFQTYRFYRENRLGLLLNLSPIGVTNRTNADKEWTNKCLQVDGYKELLSFKSWTGFDTYKNDYFPNLAKFRSRRFKELLRKYSPAVIYCGGKEKRAWSLEAFKTLWSASNLSFHETGENSLVKCFSTWLENGSQQPTLLVIGPFYCNRTALNRYEKFHAVGDYIKDRIEEKYGKEWLANRMRPFI